MIREIAIILLSIGGMSAAGSVTGCCYTDPSDPEKGSPVSEKGIEQVLEEMTEQWMAISGVEGTAIGLFEDKPCIMILSSVAPRQLRSKIPEALDGYNIVIQQTGTFQALEDQ